jgi:hypothetical protein
MRQLQEYLDTSGEGWDYGYSCGGRVEVAIYLAIQIKVLSNSRGPLNIFCIVMLKS